MTGKRARNKQANRAAILEAVRQVFLERGYDAVTIRDVIRCNRLWCKSNAKTTQGRFCHQEMMIQQSGRSRTRRIHVLVEPRLPSIRSRP